MIYIVYIVYFITNHLLFFSHVKGNIFYCIGANHGLKPSALSLRRNKRLPQLLHKMSEQGNPKKARMSNNEDLEEPRDGALDGAAGVVYCQFCDHCVVCGRNCEKDFFSDPKEEIVEPLAIIDDDLADWTDVPNADPEAEQFPIAKGKLKRAFELLRAPDDSLHGLRGDNQEEQLRNFQKGAKMLKLLAEKCSLTASGSMYADAARVTYIKMNLEVVQQMDMFVEAFEW